MVITGFCDCVMGTVYYEPSNLSIMFWDNDYLLNFFLLSVTGNHVICGSVATHSFTEGNPFTVHQYFFSPSLTRLKSDLQTDFESRFSGLRSLGRAIWVSFHSSEDVHWSMSTLRCQIWSVRHSCMYRDLKPLYLHIKALHPSAAQSLNDSVSKLTWSTKICSFILSNTTGNGFC